MTERKSDAVRRMVAAGEYKNALKIAKGFRLGITKEDSVDMQRGYECLTHPAFFQSIGMNPAQIAQKAIATVTRLYGS